MDRKFLLLLILAHWIEMSHSLILYMDQNFWAEKCLKRMSLGSFDLDIRPVTVVEEMCNLTECVFQIDCEFTVKITNKFL